MIPKKGKAANALKKAYEMMWHDEHSPITWRNPVEITNPSDSRLPPMGHGKEMLEYCKTNSKVYPTLDVRRELYRRECTGIALAWLRFDQSKSVAVAEEIAYKRNKDRAFDAMIAWYCLIQNMSYRKREEFYGIMAAEAAAKNEKGHASSDADFTQTT
jgi:hypothetical protein